MAEEKNNEIDASELITPETQTLSNGEEIINSEGIISDSEAQNIADEAMLEQEFGDSNIRTFAESAASSASFGLTDQALVALGGEEMRKALRERRKRNTEAALAGEIAGVVAPALASGGSSVVAKGAASGVKAAAKAGLAVEKAIAKQTLKRLGPALNNKAARKLIAKSISKGSGSAVEGAFYGIGELIKEDALGTSEFNAENLASHIGTSALLGGGAGSIFGVVDGVIPVIKNNRIVDYVESKIPVSKDVSQVATDVLGETASQTKKLQKTAWGQQVYKNTPDYIVKKLKPGTFESNKSILKKNSTMLQETAEKIGQTVDKIDDAIKGTPLQPTRSYYALKTQEKLYNLIDDLTEIPGSNVQTIKNRVQKEIDAFNPMLADDAAISANELREMKTKLQEIAKDTRAFNDLPINKKIDNIIASSARDVLMETADKISDIVPGIGKELRDLNLDYATALRVRDSLGAKVEKQASKSGLSFLDQLYALNSISAGNPGIGVAGIAARKYAESDIRKRLILMKQIEKANNTVENKLKKSIKNFFTKEKKSSIPISTGILTKTNFALAGSEDKSKPKNKKEAFKKLSNNLREMQNNPEKITNLLQTNSLITSESAVNTGVALNSTLIKAVNFLNAKLPKDSSTGTGMFVRPYEPSSIELAKFERYLTAIENPMSVLDDLESGSVTREGVEAIQAVYPDLYQRIQTNAMEEIAKNPEIGYNKRVQMGILLNIPSDTSLEPSNIIGLQQTFTDEEQAQNAAKKETAVETTQGGLENIDKANRTQTGTQKTTER